MSDNVFKLGTYDTLSDAESAQRSGERLASSLPGSYSFDITKGGRAGVYVVCVSGSRADIILFQNKW